MIDAALIQLNETLAELRSESNQAAEVRATIIVNFGPTGRLSGKYGFKIETDGIHSSHTTMQLLMAVLEGLVKHADAQASEIEQLRFAIDEVHRERAEEPIL